MIASARVRDDLALPKEHRAFKLIQEHRNFGKLEIVTSRESWREQERTQDPQAHEELRASRDKTPIVSQDHRLWGFNSVDLGYRGFISSPVLTDIVHDAMFLELQAAGLKSADAHHLMYALCNSCVRFLTTDPDFLNRRQALEARSPQIRIVKPSDMLQELDNLG